MGDDRTKLSPVVHWAILVGGLLVLAVCLVLQWLGFVDDAGDAFESCRVWVAELLGYQR